MGDTIVRPRGRSIVESCARLFLDDRDRIAVLGDLHETGTSAWISILEVLGLAARRQATLWRHWRPWLALLGIAIPGAVLMFNEARHVSASQSFYWWVRENYATLDPAALEEIGKSPSRLLTSSIRSAVFLVLSSFTSGAALASLAGRTLWFSAAALAATAGLLTILSRAYLSFWPLIGLALAAPTLLCGLRRWPARLILPVALATIGVTMSEAANRTPGRFALVAWPALYLAAVEARRRTCPKV